MGSPIANMLTQYRDLASQRGWDWGNEYSAVESLIERYGWLTDLTHERSVALVEQLEAASATPAAAAAILAGLLPDPLPPAVLVARPQEIEIGSPLPLTFGDHEIHYVVVRYDHESSPVSITKAVVSAAHPSLDVGQHTVRAVEVAPAARLRLVSDATSRWSVQDDRGGAWFPTGALHKYDWSGRPFFHGNDVKVNVPASRLTITAARGTEFRPREIDITLIPGEERTIDLFPERLYDAAERGWYGGDLHVHMNYSGDQVCSPSQATLMQAGEGLHLMNLVAAENTTITYDREALEQFPGHDLPYSTPEIPAVARFGVEYRNDLLGHFEALNPDRAPSRYQTGHAGSNQPQDYPSNAVAAAEFRQAGATISYTHPILTPAAGHDWLDNVFARHGVRLPHARELVADAALGLVDSVDLTGGPNHLAGTTHLYHRLLGCGLQLAATAGTDTFLSHSRNAYFSNPPGWCRAYANLDGAPLSVEAWQKAVRACRTFATNGPWLEFDVAGYGLGETVRLDGPANLQIKAHVIGLGAERLEIVGPNGVITAKDIPANTEEAHLSTECHITESGWLAAVAHGQRHPAPLGTETYAHTSPIWITITDQTTARPSDATWCLNWLNRFEQHLRRYGLFTAQHELKHHIEIINKARDFYRAITGHRPPGC